MTTNELFFCDFPIYTVSSVGQGQFYVAGGGGQAKTGVPNVLVCKKLCNSCRLVLNKAHHLVFV